MATIERIFYDGTFYALTEMDSDVDDYTGPCDQCDLEDACCRRVLNGTDITDYCGYDSGKVYKRQEVTIWYR